MLVSPPESLDAGHARRGRASRQGHLGVGHAYLAMAASKLNYTNEASTSLKGYRAWLRQLAESSPPLSSVQDGLLEEVLAADHVP